MRGKPLRLVPHTFLTCECLLLNKINHRVNALLQLALCSEIYSEIPSIASFVIFGMT